ncbi:TLR adapter interacting with SLC15A4 on the lysosome [Hoplias malabaricus]|uniref:TLR adapter interacting with SLC15A4 on the lysosome n=1 Tax=Hoplias malabaricus TaxID=27720 RepID=UPI003461A593
MLGEAFLHVLQYTQEAPEHITLREQYTHSHTISPPETTITQLTSESPLTPRALQVTWLAGQEKPVYCRTLTHSTALTIPSCNVDDLKPCSSGSCPSFCKAYPDLQLAGDTLRGPHHPALLISPSQGPFLQSQDLSSLDAFEEDGPDKEPTSKTDKGYLVIESMQGPGSEPRLTNSMLNGFLETQLMEVYRQHMQDSLARCASSSLTDSVVPVLVPANLSSSDERKAGQGLSSSHISVRYLSTCSAPATSHFSSPVLRISYPSEHTQKQP